MSVGVIDLPKFATRWPSKRALLIGNGPSIIDAELGSQIDAFDGPVVRFNEFVLKPRVFTGTRVDLWVVAWRSKPVERLHPTLTHLMTKPPRRIQYPKQRDISKDKKWSKTYPSTGIAAALWFLETGFEVYLHGFDHFAAGQRLHYFPHDRGTHVLEYQAQIGHACDEQIVTKAIAQDQPLHYFREAS